MDSALDRVLYLAGLKKPLMEANTDYGRSRRVSAAGTMPYTARTYDYWTRERAKTPVDPSTAWPRQGDNPMKDANFDGDDDEYGGGGRNRRLREQDIEECSCEAATNVEETGVAPGIAEQPNLDPHVEALHAMLNSAGVRDEMIMNDAVRLTPGGRAKVANKLGGAVNIDVLLSELAKKLKGADQQIADDYLRTVRNPEDDDYYHHRGTGKKPFLRDQMAEAPDDPFAEPTGSEGGSLVGQPQDGKFAYESDYMGNVTIRDATSGKETSVEGWEGAQLLGRLQQAEPDQEAVQALLAPYERELEPPVRFDQIAPAHPINNHLYSRASAPAPGAVGAADDGY